MKRKIYFFVGLLAFIGLVNLTKINLSYETIIVHNDIKAEELSVSCETKGGQYTLSYNTNGGNAIASVKVPIAMPSTSYTDLPTPTKSGYYFAGWYYDSGLTKK